MDARRHATGDPRGLNMFPDVPFASVPPLQRRKFAIANHLSSVDEDHDATKSRNSAEQSPHLSKLEQLKKIWLSRVTPQPDMINAIADIRKAHKWMYDEQETLLAMMRPHYGIYLDYLS